MREEIIEKIKKEKVIAIIRGVYGNDCVKLAELLCKNGIDIMEVTFDATSEDNIETRNSISEIKSKLKDKITVGAGTVTSLKFLDQAIEAGAEFIVSPDTNVEIIKKTVDSGLVSIPGAFTPTEVMTAYNAGADFVKLFPASALEPSYIKAITAPIKNVNLLAVGGINADNVGDYLSLGIAGVGIGCLADKKLIKENKWAELDTKIKEFVKKTK